MGNLLRSIPSAIAEHPLGAPGTVERHRRGAIHQPQRPEEPGDAEEMVGVIVSEEDLGEGEADAVAHHLPLTALAAVEEDRLALAVHRQPGDVAVHRGGGGAGAQESQGEHGGKGERGRVKGER